MPAAVLPSSGNVLIAHKSGSNREKLKSINQNALSSVHIFCFKGGFCLSWSLRIASRDVIIYQPARGVGAGRIRKQPPQPHGSFQALLVISNYTCIPVTIQRLKNYNSWVMFFFLRCIQTVNYRGLCQWNFINDPFNSAVITDKIRQGWITIENISLSKQYCAESLVKAEYKQTVYKRLFLTKAWLTGALQPSWRRSQIPERPLEGSSLCTCFIALLPEHAPTISEGASSPRGRSAVQIPNKRISSDWKHLSPPPHKLTPCDPDM